jgi:exodeoxyribonuclease III
LKFSVATWNINSVRLRIDLVAKFLNDHAPDVLCLQETKCRDAEFPLGEFRRLGYRHHAINGQKGYHGVAILAKIPFDSIDRREFCAKGDARHISVRLTPEGARPLDVLTQWIAEAHLAANDAIMVGDLNIAPLETDVWSHKALLKVVSHTPIEVDKLTKVFNAGPWVDALRHFVPASEKLYTWWSYRSPDWAKADKGRRLDHIWVSRSLKPHLAAMNVLRESRGWERPSDHVPVVVDLQF